VDLFRLFRYSARCEPGGLLKFIKLSRQQTVKLSRPYIIKVLEAALYIPSHEAQKWREGVIGKSRLSAYSGHVRASSVRASKRLDMEFTFFFTLKMGEACYSEKFLPTYQIT
jgi:hypothetical protein